MRRLSFVVAGFLFTVAVNAQEFRGTILGHVLDASEAVIPGATVVVTNTATNIAVTTKTDAAGSYVVPFLQPGLYRVAAEAAGFQKAAREGIEVRVQDRLTIDMTLTVGPTVEAVSVVATAPLLESNTASVGQIIGNQQIMAMPLDGRNPYLLARLAPGVVVTAPRNFTRPFDNGGTSDFSLGGNPGRSNEVLLDGITNIAANNVIAFVPSVDATQEFRVQTNNFDAEFGRAAGGVVNVSLKSGTNELHGSVFDFLRNDALDANSFFSNRAGIGKAPLRYQQFGVSVGGPVWLPKVYNGKNRTFFFFNYEGIRSSDARVAVLAVPTVEQRAGDFSRTFTSNGVPIQIYDPVSTRPNPARAGQYIRDLFPGNRIPVSRFDAVAKAVLDYYPAPNTPGNPLTGVDNFIYSGGSPDNYNAIIVRIDRQLTSNQKVFGRVSRGKRYEGDDNLFGNMATAPAIGHRASQNMGLDYVNAIGPHDLLNLRYGFTRYVDPYRPDSVGFDLAKLNFPASFRNQVSGLVFPQFSVSGLQTLGGQSWTNPTSDTHTLQGNTTHIRGAHTIKAGGDFRIIRQNQFSAGTPSGSFSFNRGFTQGPDPLQATAAGGHAVASFLLGIPNSGSVTNNASPAFQNRYFAAYVQDDIKVTRKLTLNLGIRYELEGARTERYNRMVRGFAWNDPNPVQVPGMALRGGLLFAGVGGEPRGQTNTDFNNFAPRFGFAYSLTPHTVVRGGYGVFWADTTNLSTSTVGFSATTSFVPSLDGITPLNYLANPFPTGLLMPIGSSQGMGTYLGQSPSFADPSRRMPYTQQYSLGVQRQVGANLVLEASYVGNRGIGLATGNLSRDQIPDASYSLGSQLVEQVPNPFYGIITSGALASKTVARQVLLRPYPQFTDVSVISPTIGSATYHSALMKAEKRFSRGFTFLAGYTVSKLLDDTGSIYRANYLKAERSLSTIDFSQRFVLSGIWNLPFGKGRAMASGSPAAVQKLISGWEINWVSTFQTGPTFGVTRTLNSTGKSARLDHSSKDSMLSQYFDTSAFTPAPSFTFGNVSRTLPDVRGRGINNFDLSVIKNTALREGINVQLRGEFFNAFNRTEFGPPGTSWGTPQFGVISTVSSNANPARQVQVALKVVF